MRVLVLLCILEIVYCATLQSLHWKIIDDMPTSNLWQTQSIAVVTASFDENIYFRLPDEVCANRPRTLYNFRPCPVAPDGTLVDPICVDKPGVYNRPVSLTLVPLNTGVIAVGTRNPTAVPGVPTFTYECGGPVLESLIIGPLSEVALSVIGIKPGAKDIVDAITSTQNQFDVRRVTGITTPQLSHRSLISYRCSDTCNGTWTGKVTIAPKSKGDSVVIYAGPNADVVDVYSYVPIQFNWGNKLTANLTCDNTLNSIIGCLPPTPNAVKDYLHFASSGVFLPGGSSSKLVTSVKLSTTDLLTGQKTTIVPKYFLNDPELVVTFHPQLGDSQGNPLNYFASETAFKSSVPVYLGGGSGSGSLSSKPPVAIKRDTTATNQGITIPRIAPTPEPLVCDYSQYTAAGSLLDNLFSNTSSLTLANIPTLLWNIIDITSRDEWLACSYYAENVLFNVSDPCSQLNGGKVDPCCYPDLVQDMCCLSYPPQQAVLNEDVASNDCLSASTCTINSIRRYGTNMIVNQKLASLQLLNEPLLRSNPQLPCFGVSYGLPCYTDSDCINYNKYVDPSSPFSFSNTCVASPYTTLYSYCAIPCTADTDCSYGSKCIVAPSMGSSAPTRTCSVKDFTLGQADNGTDTLLQCLSDSIWAVDPFLKNYFLEIFDIPSNRSLFIDALRRNMTFWTCSLNDPFTGFNPNSSAITANSRVSQAECESYSLCDLPCSDSNAGYQFSFRPSLHNCSCPVVGDTRCCNYDGLCEEQLGMMPCDGICNGNSTADQASCSNHMRCEVNNQVICSNCTKAECENSGICNDDFGCIVNCANASSPSRKTPLGCVSTLYLTQQNCSSDVGTWVPAASTQDECWSKKSICRVYNNNSAVVIILTSSTSSSYTDYSLLNESQCNICGGTMVPLYTWSKGSMVPYTYWQPKYTVTAKSNTTAATNYGRWLPLFNYGLFNYYWQAARKIQVTNILKGYVADRYGNKKEMLGYISCNCASGGTCATTSTGFTTNITNNSTTTLSNNDDTLLLFLLQNTLRGCPGSPSDYFSSDALLSVQRTFSTTTLECVSISISSAPLTQFKEYTTLPFSALSYLSPPTQKFVNNKQFIKNEHGVVVGEVVWDPLGFSYTSDSDVPSNGAPLVTGGLSLCVKTFTNYTVANNNTCQISQMVPNSLGVTLGNGDLGLSTYIVTNGEGKFVPLPWGISRFREVSKTLYLCVSYEDLQQFYTTQNVTLKQKEQVVALTALFKGYPHLLINQMFTVPQFGIIAAGIIIYSILFCFACVLLGKHVIANSCDLTLPVLILTFMMLFLGNRLGYFILIIYGVFIKMEYLLVLFSELPALIYFAMLSFMIIKWAEINHFTMVTRENQGVFGVLKPFAITLNVLMFVFVGVLLILYYLLPVRIDHFECSVVESNLISKDILALIYKCVFLVFSALMAFAFPFYARKLAIALSFGNETSINKTKRTQSFIQAITLIASVASVGLLLQSFILVYQTVTVFLNLSLDMVVIVVCAFVAEILPTLALLHTYRETISKPADNRSRSTTKGTAATTKSTASTASKTVENA